MVCRRDIRVETLLISYLMKASANLHGKLVNNDRKLELVVESFDPVDKIANGGSVDMNCEEVGRGLLRDVREEFLKLVVKQEEKVHI